MGLAVHGNRVRALEDEMTAVLAAHCGAACHAPGFECKGSDLYRGQGPCVAMAPAERIDLFGELIRLPGRHGARLIWEAIDKPKLAARYREPMHPHKLAFLFVAEQVEAFLHGQREFGLIVSDEEKDVEQQLVEDLRRYKEAGTPFAREPLDLRHIVDNVHWVKSHNSRMLQLCDCCAYLCQRALRDRGKTSPSARAVQEPWSELGRLVFHGRVWPR